MKNSKKMIKFRHLTEEYQIANDNKKKKILFDMIRIMRKEMDMKIKTKMKKSIKANIEFFGE